MTVKGEVKQNHKLFDLPEIGLDCNGELNHTIYLTVKGELKQISQIDWFAWNLTWLLKGRWSKNQKLIDLPEIEPDY